MKLFLIWMSNLEDEDMAFIKQRVQKNKGGSTVRNIAFFVPAALVIFAGFILLQIFLSKKDNKWLGLMLPIICFCVAIAGSGYQIYEWSTTVYPTASAFGWVGATAAFFFTYNIPTVILLVIYFACRGKQRRQKALDKMNVQDL